MILYNHVAYKMCQHEMDMAQHIPLQEETGKTFQKKLLIIAWQIFVMEEEELHIMGV